MAMSEPPSAPARASGYYIWPAVWIGERVTDTEFATFLPIATQRMADEVLRVAVEQDIYVRAYRDGLVMFDFTTATPCPEFPARDFNHAIVAVRSLARVQLLNAHLACLSTATANVMQLSFQPSTVTTRDLLSFGDPDEQSLAFGSHSLATPLYLARFPSTYPQTLPNHADWRVIHRLVLSRETIGASFSLLRSLMSYAREDLLPLADLIQRAGAAVTDNNYPLAVFLGWSACEVVLARLWRDYLGTNRDRIVDGAAIPFIRGRRRERLLSDRDYSASHRLEMLSLVDALPHALYQDCDAVRHARNGWLHELTPVSREIAVQALNAATAIVAHRSGIELRLPCTSGFHEQPGRAASAAQ